MIGRGCAVRKQISPLPTESAFTLILPQGLLGPLACARVSLLGPCFKTGQKGGRHNYRPLASKEQRTAEWKSNLSHPLRTANRSRSKTDNSTTRLERQTRPGTPAQQQAIIPTRCNTPLPKRTAELPAHEFSGRHQTSRSVRKGTTAQGNRVNTSLQVN